jgi:hypothetical protein
MVLRAGLRSNGRICRGQPRVAHFTAPRSSALRFFTGFTSTSGVVVTVPRSVEGEPVWIELRHTVVRTSLAAHGPRVADRSLDAICASDVEAMQHQMATTAQSRLRAVDLAGNSAETTCGRRSSAASFGSQKRGARSLSGVESYRRSPGLVQQAAVEMKTSRSSRGPCGGSQSTTSIGQRRA